jgi:hypothetical protein
MPALLHDEDSMKQLAYLGETPDATTNARTPIAWLDDRSGIDWSFTVARAERRNNRHPATPQGVAWNDLRAWNSGYWSGALISPRHLLVCNHYYAAVPSQRFGLEFIGRKGSVWRPKVAAVLPLVFFDATVLVLDEEAPADVAIMDRIADLTAMPPGSPLWIQGPQHRSYSVAGTVGVQFTDAGEPFAASLGVKRGPSPFDAPLFGDGVPPVFSGDSGSLIVADVPGFGPALAGMYWGCGLIRKRPAGSETVANFDVLRAIVEAAGYSLTLGAWPGTPPPQPPRSPDINGDGKVDGIDVGHVLGQWGRRQSYADLDRNGIVDAADLAMVLGAIEGPEEAARKKEANP